MYKSLLGNTWEGRSGPSWGWDHAELLTTMRTTNSLEDITDILLSLDQGAQHIREEGMLSQSHPGTSLSKVWLVSAKSLGEGGVDVIHKNTSNVNGVFL
jgi:hypothetical protein